MAPTTNGAAVNAALTLAGTPGPYTTGRSARARRRRSRRPVEATDYAKMMRRMIDAHGRRVADADVEDLADLIALERTLAEAIAYAVDESRARHGRSWADIGRAAGTSRQAAEQRWGRS